MYTFTSEELWLLLSQFAPTVVMGIEDPTMGFLDFEVADLVLRTQIALFEKGFIEPKSSTEWQVNKELNEWLNLIENSSSTIILVLVNNNQGGKVNYSVYYSSAGYNISQLQSSDGSYCLDNKSDVREELEKFILEPLLTKVYLNREEDPLIIGDVLLEEIKEKVHSGNDGQALNLLTNMGMTDSQSKRFIAAIKLPVISYTLMAFSERNRSEQNRMYGSSVIAGDEDIWCMNLQDENSCKIRSISKYDLVKQIRDFVSSVEAQR